MYIVKVTPFAKNLKVEYLSYFSLKPISVGDIVSVPLRNKQIKGVVLEVEDAPNLKNEIKNANYPLKKIAGISKNQYFSPEMIQTAKDVADYFATSTGSVLTNLIPENISNLIEKGLSIKTHEKINKELQSPKYILQENDEDRYSHYRSLIRENFAKKKSVLFIIPNIEDVEISYDKLSKGIEQYTFTLSSAIPEKKAKKDLEKLIKSEKPILCIATPSYLFLPKSDLGLIIFDKENSPAYRLRTRPYIDFRVAAEIYSKNIDTPLLLGDQILRATTLWRYDQHEFLEYAPIKFRSLSLATSKIISMPKADEGQFELLSKEAIQILDEAIEQNDHVFMFCPRKGLYPSIICQDCGQTVTCEHCSSPMVLYGKDATENKNYFRCHKCGETRPAGELCKHCNSWRLKTFGIGVDGVAQHMRKKYPDVHIFTLDSNQADTRKKAKDIISKFYVTPKSVLVGTELALLYLRETVARGIVVSVDSLLSLPDYRIRERVLNILIRMRALSSKTFLIQTRKNEDSIFDYAVQGNLADFYREEFKERSKFSFPPFSFMIRLTLSGKKESVVKELKKLQSELEEEEMVIFPSLTEKIKNQYVMHGLIRIDRKRWVDKKILEKLRTLPPQFKIEVDAESVI
jgi:primosomal protein N' (replication factor Y)